MSLSRPLLRLGAVASLVVALVASMLVAPGAGAVSRHGAVASGAQYARTHGYHIGIAVLDLHTGRFYGAGDYEGTFASESVIKVFIATRLLVTGQMHGATAAQAYKMVTQSDDAIASALYGRVGGDGLINWVKAHYHVPNLGTPPSRAGWWGNTHLVPESLVRVYAKLKRDPKVGPWLLNAMHHATEYGSDGTYQFFGIPSATTGAAIKQGWGDDYDDWSLSADYNSTGFVNHDRYAMAIMARGPVGTYGSQISSMLTAVARRLMPNGAFPDSPPSLARLSTQLGSANGGDRIVVHGSNLTGVRTVLFGSTPAQSVHRLSRRALRVVTPAHTHGVVGVQVVTDHGTTGSESYRFVQPPVLHGLGRHDGKARGGLHLMLKGASFKNVRRVMFGSVPAPAIRTIGTHRIAVTVPKHTPGTVYVRVVGEYGWSTPKAHGTAYTFHAPPTLTGLDAHSGPTAGGQRLRITGAGFGPHCVVSFGSVRSRQVQVARGGHRLSVIVPKHGRGTYIVRVRTGWGLSAKSAAARYTFVPPQR